MAKRTDVFKIGRGFALCALFAAAAMAAGATCMTTVTFTPAASGKRSGKIELTDTVPGGPQSITLTGSGK
jgi:hypothetical protein